MRPHDVCECVGGGHHVQATDLGSQPPLAGVEVALHDDALDLGHNAVVTGQHGGRRHQSNTCTHVNR